jgi:hypothetical protein
VCVCVCACEREREIFILATTVIIHGNQLMDSDFFCATAFT